MVSLVSQFLPTFLRMAQARRSLRSLYQSLTSMKRYTVAWGCDPGCDLGVLRSVLLTAVSSNPVFISFWVILSYEATVLLKTGQLETANDCCVCASMHVVCLYVMPMCVSFSVQVVVIVVYFDHKINLIECKCTICVYVLIFIDKHTQMKLNKPKISLQIIIACDCACAFL